MNDPYRLLRLLLTHHLCRRCNGTGRLARATFGYLDGEPGTVLSKQECPRCLGKAYRRGLAAPV